MSVRVRGDEVRVSAWGSSVVFSPAGIVYRELQRRGGRRTYRWDWADVALVHAGSIHPTTFIAAMTVFTTDGHTVVLRPTRCPGVKRARSIADALAPLAALRPNQLDLAMFREATWARRGMHDGLTVEWWSGKHLPTPEHHAPGDRAASPEVRIVITAITVVGVLGVLLFGCLRAGSSREREIDDAVDDLTESTDPLGIMGSVLPAECRDWTPPSTWDATLDVTAIAVRVNGAETMDAFPLGAAAPWPQGATLEDVLTSGWGMHGAATDPGIAEVVLSSGAIDVTGRC